MSLRARWEEMGGLTGGDRAPRRRRRPEEAERALMLMTERYLLDAFDRPSDAPSPERTEAIFGALETVWVSTLYGTDARSSERTGR